MRLKMFIKSETFKTWQQLNCTNWKLDGKLSFSHLTFWYPLTFTSLAAVFCFYFMCFLTPFTAGSSSSWFQSMEDACCSLTLVFSEQHKYWLRGWGQGMSWHWCAGVVMLAYFPKREKPEMKFLSEENEGKPESKWEKKRRKDWEVLLKQKIVTEWS